MIILFIIIIFLGLIVVYFYDEYIFKQKLSAVSDAIYKAGKSDCGITYEYKCPACGSALLYSTSDYSVKENYKYMCSNTICDRKFIFMNYTLQAV